ncbi:MAG: nuclear transport factor 2 family protein [Gemmatimonadetes bacterium]|uniref:Nuclear transport factor 2 family protein n=1 Tax=Candidatus Kutchimonas denitrificans TaxID=3056748 RepID=A0AAE4Z7Q1_9BACT|nr:nuclear transport factor 2 family protein [Gemmatimonadota bacterium]NIR75350.1 nuclear transport factor 2 family protein [Candidatus Kutchimonas denitrificans]NIS00982.1 nuclear transport factor 2 family protein [Gemmatimonadota bacterium]NIT66609.1 nuclear transport factor 2 family protein [Gemmatimonadota bacterium]NIU53179.1 hypothetical protein [Gemmatimonadota bacterium]
MRFYDMRRPVLLSLAIAFVAHPLAAQTPPETDPTPEAVVAEIYDLVSFEAGNRPDWDKVRSLFIPQAVIVLRTSRDATSVFSVDEFVDDFVNFIENTPAGAQGFTERIIRTNAMVFGEMAYVLVLYEAQITGSPRPPTRGVDGFSLIRKDGRWLIVSITNEIPSADRPIPEVLRH